MAKIYSGSVPIEQIFKFNKNAPIDDRFSVQSVDDLSGLKAYVGLVVYVQSEDKFYYYNGSSWQIQTSSPSPSGGGLEEGDEIGTINGKTLLYKRSISLSATDVGLPETISPYIHIGYSDDGGLTLSSSGQWIGFYVSTSNVPSNNPDDYRPWIKLAAGVGVAEMKNYYKLGNATAPEKPTVNSLGVVSGNWIKEEVGVPTPVPTSEYQYLWVVVITRFTDNTYSVSNPHVAGIKGSDAIIGDLDNEMDSIPLDYLGKTVKNEVKSTNLSIYFGSQPVTLTLLTATSDTQGITIDTTVETGKVIVSIPQGITINGNIEVTITGKSLIGTVSKVFTITTVKASKEGENAIIYQIRPSESSIKVNSSGTYSTIYLTVTVNKIDGYVTSAVQNLLLEGLYLFYKIDNGDWKKYSSQITVNNALQQVKLRLTSVDTTNENFNGILYDLETIPVVKDGQNGTSIRIIGRGATLPDPSGYEEGDAFITNDGHIWVIINGRWEDCGIFLGEPGVSSYIHIKYSDDGGTSFTSNNGEDEGPYMGFYVDNLPEDSTEPTDYTWHKISGDDGPGQEFIFKLVEDWDGDENTKPTLTQASASSSEFLRDEYLPEGWEDDPTGVDEDHLYEFYSQRKKISGLWQPFGDVILWSRYAKDGETTVFYQLVLDKETIRGEVENKIINVKILQSLGETSVNVVTGNTFTIKYSIDGGAMLISEGISSAQTGVNINISTATDYVNFYLYNGLNLLASKSCNIITGAIGIQSVQEFYKVTSTNTTPSKSDNDWSSLITQVTKSKPYLWNYEKCLATDGVTILGETEVTLIATYSEEGRGITEIHEYYQISNQSVTPPNRWNSDDKSKTTSDEAKTILNTWKTNADLTTTDKPYLWNFAAVLYSKSPFYEYEVPLCIGVLGGSPLLMDLTNEMDSFIVSENGVYEGEELSLSTTVNVFLGTEKQTTTISVVSNTSSVSVTNDVTINNNNTIYPSITVKIRKNRTYSEKIELAITATSSSGPLSKTFTITPVPGGENAVIYQILPSHDIIKVDKNANYSPTSITSSIRVITGKSTEPAQTVPAGLTLKYSKDNGSFSNYSGEISTTGVNQKIVFLLLNSSNTVLDQETIPVVFDGADGEASLFGDLDNEMDSIVTDSNGILSSPKILYSNGSIFLGTHQLTITDVSFSNGMGLLILINSNGTAELLFNIPAGTYVDSFNIQVTLICALGSIEKTFTVGIVKGGKDAVIFNLSPLPSIIKINKNGVYELPSDGNLAVYLKKTQGDSSTFQLVTTNLLTQLGKYTQYKANNDSSWTKITSGTINLSTINKTNLQSISFRLINKDSTAENPSGVVYYDRETVPVMYDGTDATGLTGDLDNEMVGFALNSDGYTDSDHLLNATTNLSIYYGTEPQTITGCNIINPDVERTSAEYTITNGVAQVTITLNQDEDFSNVLNYPYNYTITGTCSRGSITRIFTVCFYKSGDSAKFYQLQTSSSVIKKTPSGYSDNLTVTATKIEGKTLTSVVSGVYCYYSVDNSSTWNKLNLSPPPAELPLQTLAPTYNIRLRLQSLESNSDYDSNGQIPNVILYDKETLPVVADGENARLYTLKTSTSEFYRGIPLEVSSWTSLGDVEEPYPGYFVAIEKNRQDEIVARRDSYYNLATSKISWTPDQEEDTYSVDFYLFKTSSLAIAFLNGSSQTITSHCQVIAHIPEITLNLEGVNGTISYQVSSENKVTQESEVTIVCRVYAGGYELDINTISVTGEYSSGMLFDSSSSQDNILVFKASVSDQIVPTIQEYTIAVEVTYAGDTYTRYAKVIFAPILEGASIQGATGCIVRYRGFWEDITGYGETVKKSYFNCDSSHKLDLSGWEENPKFRYIDVVRYNNKYYKCKYKHVILPQRGNGDIIIQDTFHSIDADKYIPGRNYQGTSYWEEASEFDFIVTDSLIAELISSLTISAKDVIITETQNNETSVVAGMTSSRASVGDTSLSVGNTRIWSGTIGPNPDIQSAPFRVLDSGRMIAKNAFVEGTIAATDFSLYSGQEEVLHLSTFGILKDRFPGTTLASLNYNYSLPIFFIKDTSDGSYYYIPLTKIEPNTVATYTFNETRGYDTSVSRSANSLITEQLFYNEPTLLLCYLCSSTSNLNLNETYFITNDLTSSKYNGTFILSRVNTNHVTFTRGSSSIDTHIAILSVMIVTNGKAVTKYAYVGPDIKWNSTGLVEDKNNRKFYNSIITNKQFGLYPESDEKSDTFLLDFLGSSANIRLGSGHLNPGILDINE